MLFLQFGVADGSERDPNAMQINKPHLKIHCIAAVKTTISSQANTQNKRASKHKLCDELIAQLQIEQQHHRIQYG